MTLLTAQIFSLAEAGFVRWLLGLERVDPTDPTVVLSWGHKLPAWAWALIIITVIAAAVLSYRRMLGRRAGRIMLAAARALLLLIIAVLLARPMLVLPRENVEPDHVLMLVDRSASMGVKDVVAATDPAARLSRDEQLRQVLAANAPLWDQLAKDHVIDWLAFAEQVAPIAGPGQLQDPAGRATALRTALGEAIRRAAGKPISGVVIFSDGRSSEPAGSETVAMLKQAGVEVFAVPLGSPDPPLDMALQRVDAPDRAFVNDAVPIAVTISRTGADADAAAPPGTMVKLIDKATGEVLDEKPLERFDEPVRLLTTPKAAGNVTWRVELSGTEAELIQENNRQDVEIALLDRPIRLLLVEGYPRWEYRFLKNAIIRESSVESSIMLVSADRTFAQEGTVPLRRLPRTEEEFKPYDVVIIGDVPAGFFSSGQMRLLQEQVAQRGAGLMCIGGERDTPASYDASPLSALLPITTSGAPTTLSPPVTVEPTPIAQSLGVLRLISPEDPQTTWPDDLPGLFWAQAIDGVKPAAEPLAVDASTGQPIVVRMRYGAGQTMYVATDETWRWRYGRGDLYGDQFWMQLIRLLARGRLQSGAGSDDRAALIVSHRRAATGDTLVVELKIHDQTLMQPPPTSIEVEAMPEEAGSNLPRQTMTLTATGEPGTYRGTWSPRVAGRFALKVVTPALADLGLAQNLEVERADDELRYPATDHALLGDLAQRTGGAILPAGDLSALNQKLANRARRTAADISEELSHSPLVFALLLGLLTAEWVGRRVLGLA